MKNLLQALNKVMAAVGYVQKESKNTFHNYKYASEEDLLTTLRPALVKEGLLLIPSLDGVVAMDEHGNTNLVMDYTLAHVSGEIWDKPIRVPGCGNDKNTKGGVGDKGTYKALTGANKYLLFKLFQIATGDDPEKAAPSDDAPAGTFEPTPRPTNTKKVKAEAPPLPGEEDRFPKSDIDHEVQLLKKQNKPDWSTWVSTVEDKFAEAATIDEVEAVIDANDALLLRLREETPSMFEHLKDAANIRRKQLGEK
jgi:hypothetical protein